MNYTFSRPSLPLVLITQSLLGGLFLVGVGVIATLPGLSAEVATSHPEYAGLRTPLLALAIAISILALVSLAMVALLVNRIHHRTVLARSSLLWVDVIVGSLVCAVVLVIVGAVVISNGQAGSPFLALTLAVIFLALSALALITLVLRSLLRHAILMRTELDEVV